MLTPEHILAAFRLLGRAGVRHDYDTAEALTEAATLYAATLADVTEADLTAAVLAYLRAPLAKDQWSKPWPGPWTLLAHVPDRRAATVDDAEEAWAKVLRIARERGRAAGAEDNRWRFDPDAARMRAMWAGIDAAGGWDAICNTTEHGYMRPAFIGAYRSSRARRALAIESEAVAQIAEGTAPKRIEQRGGGFRAAFGPPAGAK